MTRRAAALVVLVVGLAATRAGGDAADPDAWRLDPPTPGRPVRAAAPRATRLVLSNGIPVLVLPRRDRPLVVVSVVVDAGAARATAATAGLPNLVSRLLLEGTTRRGAVALAADADALGARLGRRTLMDATVVAVDALAEALDPALDLLAEVVQEPAFAPAALERVRAELDAELAQIAADPARGAVQLVETALYGPAHPYGLPIRGTPAALGRVTRADLVAFHAAHYRPGGITLVVVGDVTPQAARARLEPRFGRRPRAAAPPAPAVAAPPPLAGPVIHLVDRGAARPAAAQAQIRFGLVGLPQDDPDFALAELANAVFGGSYASRLNANLRERQRLTYGAASFVAARRGPGPVTGGAAVAVGDAAAAVGAILDELEGMRSRPPTPLELEGARARLAALAAGRFETNAAAAQTLAELAVHRQPPAELDRRAARLDRATPAEVLRVSRRLFDPRRLLVVVVGPAGALAPELRRYGQVVREP